MRRRRRLPLGINLNDSGSGNDVFIREVGHGLRKHDVSLARNPLGDGVDFVVLVAAGDADLDR